MSDIFQEVEEDVRRERYEQIWKQYGNYIMAAAVVVVLAVAGFQAWRNYDLGQREKISDRYREASQAAAAGDATKAETKFNALAKEAPQGYATLAKFHLSAAYLAQGKRDPAVTLLRELTASSDALISNTARLRLAWIEADATPKAEITTLLAPLTADDSPWRFAASEVLAYVDLKGGARNEALATYQKLALETEAPASLRQRAAGIAEFLKANPDGTAAAAPATAAPAATVPAAGNASNQGTKPQ